MRGGARRRQQECVFPLAPRDVKKSEETLLSLKEMLVVSEPLLHKLAEMRGFELTHAKQVRLRGLDKQMVPRYVFYDNARALSKDKRIAGFKRLAIQLLPEPEQLTSHTKLYFVQHRDLARKTNSPRWPCNEILLDVGRNPSLSNLHAVLLREPKQVEDEGEGTTSIRETQPGLARAQGITEHNHLEIARWDAKSLKWRRLVKNGTAGGKKKRGKKGRRGGPSRLTLQNGDLEDPRPNFYAIFSLFFFKRET